MALFWKRKDASPEPFGNTEPVDSETATRSPLTEPSIADSAEPQATPTATGGVFGRMKSALSDRLRKTREDFVGQIRAAVKAASVVDEHLIERIEEILIQADVGAETTMKMMEAMREFEARGAAPQELLDSFKKQLLDILGRESHRLKVGSDRPYVVLVIGVNGVGKTTTIGKIAAEMREEGHSVLLAAADTFRAAAVEQLEIWSQRTGCDFVSKEMGADPAGVAYDAVEKARAGQNDVVLIDTAGRLHTKNNLMEELKKIVRVLGKLQPGAPHETLLVLDATTGQNAISQARVFTEAIPITGLVMTKLDGTAKGGVLIGIRNLFDVPIVKIGVGESVEDLRDFVPAEFVDALFTES